MKTFVRMKLKNIEAVGFDLDGTLYPNTREIDNRIRTLLAGKVLEKKPGLKDIGKARKFFDERYGALQSITKILKEVGYGNEVSEIKNWCLVNANILDLIEPNQDLVEILRKMHDKYTTYLLTSSPEELSYSKLEKIGINPDTFHYSFFSDIGSKSDGDAFDYVLYSIQIPAERHVYCGDEKIKDILPAKKRGMKTIAIGSKIPEADICIENINKIEEVLS